jgi:hypothetical protein
MNIKKRQEKFSKFAHIVKRLTEIQIGRTYKIFWVTEKIIRTEPALYRTEWQSRPAFKAQLQWHGKQTRTANPSRLLPQQHYL